MKIAYCSDLHLEFGPLEINNDMGADVLILGGDICVAAELVSDQHPKKAQRYLDFFQQCNDKFPVVFYLMGNHEHYHGDFAKSADILGEALVAMTNIYIVDKSWVVIPDVVTGENIAFVGGTLWTNFRDGDPELMRAAPHIMNDFRNVKNTNNDTIVPNRFTAQDSYNDHAACMDVIEFVADNFDKVVVTTHHAPVTRSKRPEEFDDSDIHAYYNSDLEQFILKHPSIKVWTHGHTHAQYEWVIGDCQVLCNPRGYIGYQEVAEHFQLKMVEI